MNELDDRLNSAMLRKMKAIKPPKRPNPCTPYRAKLGAMNGKNGCQRTSISHAFGHMISQRGKLSPNYVKGDFISEQRKARAEKDRLIESVKADRMVIHLPCRQAIVRHAESMLIKMGKKLHA